MSSVFCLEGFFLLSFSWQARMIIKSIRKVLCPASLIDQKKWLTKVFLLAVHFASWMQEKNSRKTPQCIANAICNIGFVFLSSIVFLSSVDHVHKHCQWLGFIWCLLAQSHHLLIIRAIQNMKETSPSQQHTEALHGKVLRTTHYSHFSSYAGLK